MRLKFLLLALMLAMAAWSGARAEDFGHTARGLFMMLPPSVFESTAEGLTESEKQELLANGQSEFWEISGESPDVLVFTALPFRDVSIGLRIFRDDRRGGVEAAIGTLGEPICTLELWRLDASGRLTPVDTPVEPDPSEFFSGGHKFSKGIRHSVLMCLGEGGLEAKPLFWNEHGMLPAKVENEIRYLWTGEGFQKSSRPAKQGQ